MKYLSVNLLKPVDKGVPYECSNGGVSSRRNAVFFLPVAGGIYSREELEEMRERGKDVVILRIVRRNLFGNPEPYIHVEPEEIPKGVHSMFGSCYITSSDSRVSGVNKYPIPLHDRVE